MKLLKIVIVLIGLLIILRFIAPAVLPRAFSYVFNSGLAFTRSQVELLLISASVIIVLLLFRIFRMKK